MELYPKSRIVMSAHPSGAAETMAPNLSAALQATGCDGVLKRNSTNGKLAVLLLSNPAPPALTATTGFPLQ